MRDGSSLINRSFTFSVFFVFSCAFFVWVLISPVLAREVHRIWDGKSIIVSRVLFATFRVIFLVT